MMKRGLLTGLFFTAFFVLVGCGEGKSVSDAASSENTSAEQVHTANGTVKAVDPTAGKITIDHEAISSLNWPPMTMTFEVKDAIQLNIIRPGDHVLFSLVESNGEYVIQQLHRQ